ncbi:MAG: Nif3-like dinuclear metal center hexameric protein [Wujia sp.]
MKCSEIIKILERQSPREYAMEWDNVGLLVGRRDKEVKKIMIAVDATESIVQAAIEQGVDMIITHHPIIFSKQGRVNDETPLGRKLLALIENGIACYAMHTNFDTKGGMAKEAAAMMGFKNTEVLEETLYGEGLGQTGILDKPMTVAALADKVKQVFELDSVMVYGNVDARVEKVAILPGSGKSDIGLCGRKGVECLITGDIGHHEGLDALELGVNVIDASHYGIEKIFMGFMYRYLKDFCTGVEIGIADSGVPFVVM